MSTPSGPDDEAVVEAGGALEAGDALDSLDALDAFDADVLERLEALHDRLDGPPSDFTELVVFAVAAHGLEVELARLEEGVSTARAAEEATRSLTFEADSLSVLVRVAAAGGDRVRLDGWLAPPVRAVVELRRPGGEPARRAESGDDGRFVLDDVPRGLVQVVVRRGSAPPPVVTPTFEL